MDAAQRGAHEPSRPAEVWVLLIGTLFLSLTALIGGFYLVRDPTGQSIGLVMAVDLSHLDGTPFTTYTIPGLILVVFLGLYPLAVLYGQLTRRSWAWSGSLLMGIVLLVWIVVEVYLIGYISPLQPAYGLVGIALVALCLLPSVRRYYREM
ncbi:hypothetical protein [Haloarchaeobius sp. HRN-SO-5]|uniref:hypothetical protein n=1 Tax=Haloarchaeobius sp. HRN-SO-5 TaxID=3446118 RepID=UPI003EBC7166